MTVDRSLVLGASGFIGRHLLTELGSENAVGTGNATSFPGNLGFDALTDDIETLLDDHGPFQHAFILLAESHIDRCAKLSERSYALNVGSTRRMVDALLERGILPVFTSTDCVFDGARGGYVETDAANPILTYGRQKLDIEQYLAKSGAPYIVARLSKVVDADPMGGGMLGEWMHAIREGKESHCAVDQRFSAIDIRDAVQALIALADGAPSGVYHVGGPRPWDRASLFEALVAAVRRYGDVTPALHRCGINDFPQFAERRPLDISMRSDKLSRTIGIVPRDIQETCEEIARAAYG